MNTVGVYTVYLHLHLFRLSLDEENMSHIGKKKTVHKMKLVFFVSKSSTFLYEEEKVPVQKRFYPLPCTSLHPHLSPAVSCASHSWWRV